MTSGAILAFAGATAPTGYVLCDGSLYDGTNATYQTLWAVIGTTYGGTARSSFAVPDLRGRGPTGLGPNAAVNALGLDDGVAAAYRRGTKHQHTPHYHVASSSGYANTAAAGSGANNHNADFNTASADGGSGVSTDPLDGGGFVVVNFIIAL